LECLDRQIEAYRKEKKVMRKSLKGLSKIPGNKATKTLPGIGDINAVKIVSRIVTPL